MGEPSPGQPFPFARVIRATLKNAAGRNRAAEEAGSRLVEAPSS